MTAAHARERDRLLRVIDAQERELEHRAEMLSDMADMLAEAHLALGDAVAVGTELATALRWAVPDSPALLRVP